MVLRKVGRGAKMGLMRGAKHDGELTSVMVTGEKDQNKAIHQRTALKKILSVQSDRSGSIEAIEEDLLSLLLANQEFLIERIESLDPAKIKHDLRTNEAEKLIDDLTSFYQQFASNQVKIYKHFVSGAELDAQLAINETVHGKATIFKTQLSDYIKSKQSELEELSKTRDSLVMELKSMEKAMVDNIKEDAISMRNRLAQIKDVFASTQGKIEALVQGTNAQRGQLEIGDRIRHGVDSIQKHLECCMKYIPKNQLFREFRNEEARSYVIPGVVFDEFYDKLSKLTIIALGVFVALIIIVILLIYIIAYCDLLKVF